MKKIIILLLSVFGVATLAAGCGADDGKTATVESVAVICGIGSTSNVERYAGVIESGSDVKVEKDPDKKVAEVLVKVGDTVSKDQVLFRYDKAQTELNIQKTQIEIEQLQNSVTTKQNEIKTLENEINAGNLDADTKTGYMLQIQELNADITETNLSVRSKQAELENQQNTLNNLEVKAPDEGTIQSVNNGNNDTGDGSSQGNAFIVIRKTSAFRVKGYVNETNKNSLYEGMEVLIRSRIDDAIMKGNIKNIDLKNPTSSGNSDMYGMEGDDTSKSNKYPFCIELENTDGFIIGQHVYIEPDYGQGDISEDSILLPSYYINDAKTTPWVWARDGKERLEKRTVTLGTYDSDMDAYEVKNGLDAQDYIAAPDDTLKAGMKCVEFDFTSDDFQDLNIEEFNSGEDLMLTETGGSDGTVDIAPEDSDPNEITQNNPGNSGGYTPGMMSPFLGVPASTTSDDETGKDEGNEDDSAPESGTVVEEVQAN